MHVTVVRNDEWEAIYRDGIRLHVGDAMSAADLLHVLGIPYNYDTVDDHVNDLTPAEREALNQRSGWPARVEDLPWHRADGGSMLDIAATLPGWTS